LVEIITDEKQADVDKFLNSQKDLSKVDLWMALLLERRTLLMFKGWPERAYFLKVKKTCFFGLFAFCLSGEIC
jgi:hypothetical protein